MAQIKIYSDLKTGLVSFEGARLADKEIGSIEAIAHPSQSNRVIVKSTRVFKRGSSTEFRVFFKRLNINRIQNKAGQDLTSAPFNYNRDQILAYLNEQFEKPVVNEYFEYDPATDRLVAQKDIEVQKSGFFLGGKHKMASGASNIYYEDLDNKANSYPVFGEVLDQSLAANQLAGEGVTRPKSRIFQDFQSTPLGGSPVNDTAIGYDGDNFFPFNISGVGITTRVAEVVAADQQLKYEIVVNGISVYVQYLEHNGLAVNEDLTWYFDHPLDIEDGTTLRATIYKVSTVDNQEQNDGILQVCEGDATPTRYQTNVLNRFFSDEPIALKTDVDALLSGSTYKGSYNGATASPTLPTGSDVLGDFYRVTAAGGGYATGDILVFNGTDYDHIAEANATQSDIKNSGLKIHDIYVKAGYSGAVKDGSVLYPYDAIETAVGSANDGDSIYLEGTFEISGEITLPTDKSLYFYGSDDACISFATYSDGNGSLLHFSGTDSTKEFKFKNITFKNAGGYGLYIKKATKVEIDDCVFTNNGWNGTALNTILPSTTTALLGYDSSNVDLQAFYAGSNASNGGAMRLEEITQVLITGNTVTKNLRGIRVQDCGVNGAGVITRNQVTQNIESGIYLAAGSTHYGCSNITVSMNVSGFNANNGLLTIGGINNKFSQNEVKGNWNAGACFWGAANTTLRDCGLYDNNRSEYNGTGETADAKASIQINEAFDLQGTSITLSDSASFIAEILDTQVHNTGLGSVSEKIGFLLTSDVGALSDNDKNIIKVDDVGFIGQDYAIDLSEVDVSNLRLSLGDNSYQSIALGAVKAPAAGNYSELPFSNHLMSVPSVDVVVDTLKQTLALHEGVGGNVINSYHMNELVSNVVNGKIDILLKTSDKIQLRGLAYGSVYINGVVAGNDINSANDSLNAAFGMDLVEYKSFLVSEVGINGTGWYYVESPDGEFYYPLFSTEDEANYIDSVEGGSGSSHTHTFADDTYNGGSNTWYMPDTSGVHAGASAPQGGIFGNSINVVWNEIPTGDDANYLPTFNNITYNVQEGNAINIQYKAQGMTDTFNITGVPAGYADNGYAIIGTAEDITNGYGQSITHVLNVTKANNFGSVQGTITINVKANLAGNEFTLVDQNGSIKFTQDNGVSVLDFNTVTFNAGSTYRFYLDGSTLQTNDYADIVDGSGNGITGNDGLSQSGGSGPGYAGTYLQYVIPSDVAPGKFIRFIDGATSTTYTDVPLTIAGSSYTADPIGVDLEGPAANQSGSVIVPANGSTKHGWLSLDETLAAGQRLVLDNAFFTELFGYANSNAGYADYEFAIGLKGDNWVNTQKTTGSNFAATGIFKGDAYLSIRIVTSNQVRIKAYANGTSSNEMLIGSAQWADVCAFLDITSSGNNVRIGFGRNGSSGVSAGDESTVTYADWNAYKVQTGDQGYGITNLDVMFLAYNSWSATAEFDTDEIDWTLLSEISVPVAPTNATSWTKGIDFSGGNEHLKQVSTSTTANAIRMGGLSVTCAAPATSGNTSNDGQARPWATAIVFNSDFNSSNQHIWNSGEGASTGNDNIYLRTDANGLLYFGWGRDGTGYNECRLGGQAITGWRGVYIAHTGERLSGANATASNLADCFDIRIANGSNNWVMGLDNYSTTANWISTGARMDRAIEGDFTIGGRGGNRNFHGKVASMVVTTLDRNVAMPDATEVEMMITDPVGWLDDYKVGNTYRQPHSYFTYNFALDNNGSGYATQVYLMGDGSSDSYANGVRNEVIKYDQNLTKLQFNSMLSNDIQNVTITGLS